MKKIIVFFTVMVFILSGCAFNKNDELKTTLGNELEIAVEEIEFIQTYPRIDVSEDEMILLVRTDVLNQSTDILYDSLFVAEAEVNKKTYQSEPIYGEGDYGAYLFSPGEISRYVLAFKIQKQDFVKNVSVTFYNEEKTEELGSLYYSVENFELLDNAPVIEYGEEAVKGSYRGVDVLVRDVKYLNRADAAAWHPKLVNDFFNTNYFLVDFEVINNTDEDITELYYVLGYDNTFETDDAPFNGASSFTELLTEYQLSDNVFDENVPAHSSSRGQALFLFDNTYNIDFDDLYIYVRPFYGDVEWIKMKIKI